MPPHEGYTVTFQFASPYFLAIHKPLAAAGTKILHISKERIVHCVPYRKEYLEYPEYTWKTVASRKSINLIKITILWYFFNKEAISYLNYIQPLRCYVVFFLEHLHVIKIISSRQNSAAQRCRSDGDAGHMNSNHSSNKNTLKDNSNDQPNLTTLINLMMRGVRYPFRLLSF